MTHAILRARLRELGFDPALFCADDLDSLLSLRQSLPPAESPALPPLAAFPPPAALCADICAAAQSCLDALGTDLHALVSFSDSAVRAACADAASALALAIPRWQEELAVWAMQASEVNAANQRQLVQAQDTLRHLLLVQIAARLCGAADAEAYRQAADAYAAAIAEREFELAAGERDLLALEELIDLAIPALLDAAAPLFSSNSTPFSRTDFRIAALRLREAANRFALLEAVLSKA